MPFRIDEFVAENSIRHSVLPTNRFKVTIPMSSALLSKIGTDTTRALSFWCEEAQVPGYQLLSHNVRRHTYGTNETRPFSPNFQPIQLTFAADTDSTIWNVFNTWTQFILPHDATSGILTQSAYGSDGNHLVYELSYKDEYKTDMIIDVFDKANQPSLSFLVRDSFPSNLNLIPLAWGEQNNYAKFTVFIEYLDWQVQIY